LVLALNPYDDVLVGCHFLTSRYES
jgi:hypothetical protein